MASPATFVAYIDEAGDEGFKFGKGSSEWFVLGAAVLRRATEMPEIKLIDDVRVRLNRGRAADRQFPAKKALHFRDLQHDVRKYYASRIAQANLISAVVLIKKRDWLSDFHTPAERKEAGRLLYARASTALIHSISRCCQQEYHSDDAGDGSVDLIFSSRSTLDYDLLRSFVASALNDTSKTQLHSNVSPTIIRASQIQAVMHSKSMGLQIADAVTSSYFYAVEPSQDGFTEDTYVRLLLPCAYNEAEKLIGKGVRFDFCSTDTVEEMQKEVARWQR